MRGTARRLLEDLTHTLIAPLRCRFISACVAFTAAYANPGSDLGGRGFHNPTPYPCAQALMGASYHHAVPASADGGPAFAYMAVPVNAVRAALHHLTEASGLEAESHVHSLVATFRNWLDEHHPVARAFVVLRTQEQRRADGIDGENTAPLPNGITISAATRPLDPMEVYVVYRTADAWYAPPAMMREINLQPRSDGAVHGGNDTVAEVAAIVNHDDRVNLPNVAAPSGDSDAQGRRFVSQYSTLYDTLRYVLFFPTGVGGWGQRGLGRSAQRPLSTAGHPFTCGGYARAAIYQKEVLSLLLRLTQEYMLDEFSRRESIGVLSYARSDPGGTFTRTRNRATARRVARRDAAIEAGVAGAADRTIGRPRVYLPASLPGSPKHQQMLVDDGLAVIEKYGKPTYVCQCVLNLTHVSQSMCTLQLLHYVHV